MDDWGAAKPDSRQYVACELDSYDSSAALCCMSKRVHPSMSLVRSAGKTNEDHDAYTESAQNYLIQQFITGSGYDGSLLYDSQHLQEIIDDLDVKPLMQFMSDPGFKTQREQLALPSSVNKRLQLKTGLPTEKLQMLQIAGKVVNLTENRLSLPVGTQVAGVDEMGYLLPDNQVVPVVPSQSMALVISGKLPAGELIKASRPRRRALIRERLSRVDTQSRSQLTGSVKERLKSRVISKLPRSADVKGITFGKTSVLTDGGGRYSDPSAVNSLCYLMNPDFPMIGVDEKKVP